MPETIPNPRTIIGERVRALRKERHWTQTQLAKLLGISQNYLSVLERGRGSFTAEQLLTILKTFNVPVDYFQTGRARREDQLQSALARFGAAHLHEPSEALPTEAFKEVAGAIREALASAESARQITAIAPVLAQNIDRINLRKLQSQLLEIGLGQRLGWALENTLEAIRHELRQELTHEWKLKYRRAEVLLKAFLSQPWPGVTFSELRDEPPGAGDILDPDIASEKSLAQAGAERSNISKRWGIVTRIRLEDFTQALSAARERWSAKVSRPEAQRES